MKQEKAAPCSLQEEPPLPSRVFGTTAVEVGCLPVHIQPPLEHPLVDLGVIIYQLI